MAVQVRRKRRGSITRSFLYKSDALAWARQQELEADRLGVPTAHKGLRGVIEADIIIFGIDMRSFPASAVRSVRPF